METLARSLVSPTRSLAGALLASVVGLGLVACGDAGTPLQPDGTPETSLEGSVEGIDPTSGLPFSATWPARSAAPAPRFDASVIAAATPSRVLLFGDFQPAKDELEAVLVGMGHTVTDVATLPEDLSGYDVVWHIGGFLPLAADEQTRLAAFLAGGGGVHLTGENPCCELLNGSLETFLDAVVVGGGITVGGLGDFGPIGPHFTFNPGAVGDVTTDPNALGSWSPAAPGGMAGLDPENVLVTHDATDTPNGGAWIGAELVDGAGRLSLLMDVNWLDPSVNPPAERDPEIANLQLFLQGGGTSTLAVEVDVRPGSDRNVVPLRSRGRLPVAILTTPSFDAADVDPVTVTLGDGEGAETPVATRGRGSLFATLEDVDEDGDVDLLLRFDIQALVDAGDLDGDTSELVLAGETLGGTPIGGSDAVSPVGAGR